jgi:methylation protein EvaC
MSLKKQFTKCKVTGQKVPIIFNFGKMPIANNFSNTFIKKNLYEMKIAFNESNGLFQLVSAPKPKKLFNDNYAFMSSTSNSMKIHFKKVANNIKKMMKKNSKIMEIGCNDGIFLQNFKNFDHLGIEPSKNVCDVSRSKKLNVLNSFFTEELITQNKLLNKFDIIFAANVICHIPNMLALFKCIEKSLKQDGFFIFEEPYLGAMLEKTSYDQIYDEHFYMFSANSIRSILEKFNLELFSAERIPTHGGSMRYYVKKTNSTKISEKLKQILKYEKKLKISKIKTIKKFVANCINSKKRILKIMRRIKIKGEDIYGYGATSKSTTILHFCKVKDNLIKGIFDNTPTKIGKYFPAKKIQIINYKEFKNIKPKYCFLFAWNHYKEIFKKEKKRQIKWFCHIDKKHFPKNLRKNFI